VNVDFRRPDDFGARVRSGEPVGSWKPRPRVSSRGRSASHPPRRRSMYRCEDQVSGISTLLFVSGLEMAAYRLAKRTAGAMVSDPCRSGQHRGTASSRPGRAERSCDPRCSPQVSRGDRRQSGVERGVTLPRFVGDSRAGRSTDKILRHREMTRVRLCVQLTRRLR